LGLALEAILGLATLVDAIS